MIKRRYFLERPIKDEFDEVVEIKTDSILETDELSDKQKKRLDKFVHDYVKEYFKKFKLIKIDEEIIGCFLLLTRESGYTSIDEIYLQPRFRRRGIATRIITDIVDRYKYVEMRVNKSNEPMLRVAKKTGFKIKDSQGKHYFMQANRPKTYTIYAIILFIASMILAWNWLAVRTLAHHHPIPLILAIAFFYCLLIVKIFTVWNIDTKRALRILFINYFVFVFFPINFVKTCTTLVVNRRDLNDVVERIKTHDLSPSGLWEVSLKRDEYESLNMESAHVYINGPNGQVIAFRTGEKPFGGIVMLVYSSGGKDLIRSNETDNPIESIVRITKKWYYVYFRYASEIKEINEYYY